MDNVKEAMPLIGGSKVKELERKVKELKKDEFLIAIARNSLNLTAIATFNSSSLFLLIPFLFGDLRSYFHSVM
ncbi:hypothetical protein K1719_033679 [Acacia pycnantha]|nr:hypothetical protein K1719_033679 [Acacia pycnantha]